MMALGECEDDAIVIKNATMDSEGDEMNRAWQNPKSCGEVGDRIVGGEVGTAGQFPWLVALRLR